MIEIFKLIENENFSIEIVEYHQSHQSIDLELSYVHPDNTFGDYTIFSGLTIGVVEQIKQFFNGDIADDTLNFTNRGLQTRIFRLSDDVIYFQSFVDEVPNFKTVQQFNLDLINESLKTVIVEKYHREFK